jgi:hypothetical protein
MPVKSMFSRPIGIIILLFAIAIGIIYVVYPGMFKDAEGFTSHPVPPSGDMDDNDDVYHYKKKCEST